MSEALKQIEDGIADLHRCPLPLPAVRPPRTIDEDFPCLKCGYNLRGLTGRHVCCPECSEVNDAAERPVPDALVEETLRKMEHAPTSCATAIMFSVLWAMLSVLWAVSGALREPLYAMGSVLFLAYAIFQVFATRKTFEGRPGWLRTIVDYQVAGLLLGVAFCLILGGAVFLYGAIGDYVGPFSSWWGGPMLIGGIAVGGAGVLFSRSARKRFDNAQREAAVRDARDTLRRADRRPPRRWGDPTLR